MQYMGIFYKGKNYKTIEEIENSENLNDEEKELLKNSLQIDTSLSE